MRLLITTQTVDKDDPILGFFHGWLNEFSGHFEHIDVICLNKGNYDLPSNVSIYSLGKERGKKQIHYLFNFFRYFFLSYRSGRIDYVFFHMGAIFNILASPFFLVRKFTHTKFFWWKTHGKVRQLKERLALYFCDQVFTAGTKSFDLYTSKVRVIGHAIDVKKFSNSSNSGERDPKRILMVGRIVPIKRIETAIETMRLLKEDGHGHFLDIVGAPDQLNYQRFLEQTVEAAGLNSIHFRGAMQQSEVTLVYRESVILLHPAFEAGFDKVVLEAMASGVIPLTSIPSFKEVLSSYGLYVLPNDARGYENAVIHISQMSERNLDLLRDELRDVVVKSHSLSTLYERIFTV